MLSGKYIPAAPGLLIILLLLSFSSHAQYYSTGQNPASVKWKQISTESARLIFPDDYEDHARWLATYLDSVSVHASKTLQYRPRSVPLIMHTQSAVSNALVAWAPRRMEFYTMPPQDMYAQPWLEQLSLHEYRHVVQIEKLRQGPTKVISWLFGQQGIAAVLGLYVPAWFLEGDAVATETALSRSGRGRVPQFEMILRAQLLEKGPYAYDKAVLGSYRDFIPNQYVLGYHLIAEGRRKYGPVLWEHTLNRVARRPYMVTPFQKGIKDISGQRKLPFYRDCLQSLSVRWKMQEEASLTSMTGFTADHRKIYADYRFPAMLYDGSILAMKKALNDITRIVRIRDEAEEVIYTPGFIRDESLSYASGKLCWVETRPDLRWANRSWTVIRLLDVEHGKAKTINHRRRYLAPALSADAKRIVTVCADSLDRYSLVIIDADSGEVISSIPAPEGEYPLRPSWAGDDMLITIMVSDQGKSLQQIHTGSGEAKILIPWTVDEISQAVYQHPYIYFVGSMTGIANIYRLEIKSGEISMMTGSRFGASDPWLSADGQTLLYADYRAMGFQILEIHDPKALSLHPFQNKSIGLAADLALQEEVVPSGATMKPSDAPAKKYSKLGNLFNVHSWAPLYINADNYTINPGVSVMSQNLLSSSFLTAGYSYNVSDAQGKIYGTYTYAGWYPMIDLTVDHGLRSEYAFHSELIEIKWRETNLRGGLRLPLNLRRGKYFSGMEVNTYANQLIRKIRSPDTLQFRKSDIFSMWYGFRYYRQIKSNFRDIYPRWGQSLGLYYRHTPFLQDGSSAVAAAIVNLYFPGVMRHHGLNIYGAYQQRDNGHYDFPGLVAYPRGVTGKWHKELLSLRSTYAFPLAYPDWSIGPVLYLKRIRMNLFYDYAIGNDTHSKTYYSSLGADLLFETHILRFFAPVEVGVRSIYLPDSGDLDWQFLISVGFDSFYVGKHNYGSVPPLY